MTEHSSQTDSNGVPIEATAPEESRKIIEDFLQRKQAELDALEEAAHPLQKAELQLEIAQALVGIGRQDEAWELARFAFDAFLQNEQWQQAVECCDVLYQSNQPASLQALGMGVWLAVTYPIEPSLSVNMLSYIVDETPPKADGAAVAAVSAHYIADIRTEGKEHESLTFLTKEMVARVAEGHSGVKDQESLDAWMERLQLRDPDSFLPKLALVIGAIVPPDQWWFDRDALREKLPD